MPHLLFFLGIEISCHLAGNMQFTICLLVKNKCFPVVEE
jgi:hypothetical protein